MKNILVIHSSPRGNESFSRKLTNSILDKLKANSPNAKIVVRDLSLKPTPHLEESHLTSFFTPPEQHSEDHKEAIAHSEEAISEIMEADAIIIGVPMYNFSIPSVLKAWIDHLARAGRTFRYSDKGPIGLVTGKKVYLSIATGGIYSKEPLKSMDFTEPYLKAILAFLGMTDVTTFRVEGLAIPGIQDQALEKAVQEINI